jgi:hypothetical protein
LKSVVASLTPVTMLLMRMSAISDWWGILWVMGSSFYFLYHLFLFFELLRFWLRTPKKAAHTLMCNNTSASWQLIRFLDSRKSHQCEIVRCFQPNAEQMSR